MLSVIDRHLRDALTGVGVSYFRCNLANAEVEADRAFWFRLGDLPAVRVLSWRQWLDRVYVRDRRTLLSLRRRIASGVDKFAAEFRIRGADRRWHWFRAVGSVERIDATPVWVAGVLLDIRHEKETERLVNALMERPFQFVGLISPKGVLLETNRASAAASGYRQEEMVGRHFWDSPLFASRP